MLWLQNKDVCIVHLTYGMDYDKLGKMTYGQRGRHIGLYLYKSLKAGHTLCIFVKSSSIMKAYQFYNEQDMPTGKHCRGLAL